MGPDVAHVMEVVVDTWFESCKMSESLKGVQAPAYIQSNSQFTQVLLPTLVAHDSDGVWVLTEYLRSESGGGKCLKH